MYFSVYKSSDLIQCLNTTLGRILFLSLLDVTIMITLISGHNVAIYFSTKADLYLSLDKKFVYLINKLLKITFHIDHVNN